MNAVLSYPQGAFLVSAFGAVATVSLGATISTGLFSVPVAATLLFFSFYKTVVIAFSQVLAVVLLPLSDTTACVDA